MRRVPTVFGNICGISRVNQGQPRTGECDEGNPTVFGQISRVEQGLVNGTRKCGAIKQKRILLKGPMFFRG